MKKLACNAFICPQHEYAATVWAPWAVYPEVSARTDPAKNPAHFVANTYTDPLLVQLIFWAGNHLKIDENLRLCMQNRYPI